MAKIRLYRAFYTSANGKNGYTLVKSDNAINALSEAKKLGVKGVSNVKFKDVKFMRWTNSELRTHNS